MRRLLKFLLGCPIAFISAREGHVRELRQSSHLLQGSHMCSEEAGLSSSDHLRALDMLNGRFVVMVGDSVTRYQYLALAHYLVHGTCAHDRDPDSDTLSLINEEGWNSWEAYFTATSAALTGVNEAVVSTETCIGTRINLDPGLFEMRMLQIRGAQVCVVARVSFTARRLGQVQIIGRGVVKLSSVCACLPGARRLASLAATLIIWSVMQGQHVRLGYVLYFDEMYAKFSDMFAAARSMLPTDVIFNFGAWHHAADIGDWHHPAGGTSSPSMQEVRIVDQRSAWCWRHAKCVEQQESGQACTVHLFLRLAHRVLKIENRLFRFANTSTRAHGAGLWSCMSQSVRVAASSNWLCPCRLHQLFGGQRLSLSASTARC